MQVKFLDEFRIIILVNKFDTMELLVFDTLIPQDHPGSSWELELPQRFHNWAATIYTDHERQLGVPDRGEPFIADPNQAVLVIQLKNYLPGGLAFLIVRVQALIEESRPTHADHRVPWDEWGRDAVVAEDLVRSVGWCIFVHGAQVVVTQTDPFRDQQKYEKSLRTFDFSRRGCSSLPLWGGEGGGTQRTVPSEDEGLARPAPGDGATPVGQLRSLNDGSLFCPVSCPSGPLKVKLG